MLVILLPWEVPAEVTMGSAERRKSASKPGLAHDRRGRTIGGFPARDVPTRIAPMAIAIADSVAQPRGRPATPARSRLRRVAIALSIVATILTWSGGPALAASAFPSSGLTSTTQPTAPTARTRTVDLSRNSAAVTQYTNYWCVPAAVQTMLNLVTGQSDRRAATQSRLYTELRRANLYRYSTRGNDVRGWARVMTAHLPVGMGYGDQSFSSQSAAYLAIVRAMDRTKRPVGIVVDQASHAWTVVGFTVLETPGVPNSTTVLGFYVVGPLGSPTDPWPKKYFTVAQLSSRFTRYHESQRAVVWEGLYVIVAPISTFGSATPTR
jgi:hypothetical protein